SYTLTRPNLLLSTPIHELLFCLFVFNHTSTSTLFSIFFFNDTATTDIYTLSLHDALPILSAASRSGWSSSRIVLQTATHSSQIRSEEHTSELQSRGHLVCRLLLEKKNGANAAHVVRAPRVEVAAVQRHRTVLSGHGGSDVL